MLDRVDHEGTSRLELIEHLIACVVMHQHHANETERKRQQKLRQYELPGQLGPIEVKELA